MALEGGEGLASHPGRSLPPGRTRYPLYRRLGGPQGQSGQVRKISPPPGFDPRPVQPIASRYTDHATRPTKCQYTTKITVSQPIRQYLSLHRVTISSGNNKMPFPVGSFTILTFQTPAFAYAKACRKTPLTQQAKLLHFVDILYYLFFYFPQSAIYFIILSLSVQNNTFSIKTSYTCPCRIT